MYSAQLHKGGEISNGPSLQGVYKTSPPSPVLLLFLCHLHQVWCGDEAVSLLVENSKSFPDLILYVCVLELPFESSLVMVH